MSFSKYLAIVLFSISSSYILIPNIIYSDVISDTVSIDIQEPVGTYDTTAPTLLNMFARTVIEVGACTVDDYDGCTLNDVLNDINSQDDFKPEVKVHLTADDFPDDGLVSNAKIRQRGDTSRSAPQKSFRIKLDSKDDLWRGERRIQLLKSFYDFSRVRNKLSYDLFSDIPHLPSMRSQFVNLTLEDQGVTQNLGLYTSVEHFGKEYLKRRGWDKDSRVYKAEHFYFQNRPEFALDAEGVPIDEDAFEEFVEIKRGKSHHEFVDMVNAVNDFSADFQADVFNKYFDQDNYLTWFAVNLLVNNIDTDAHNYYLYNPKNTENFYFVPWDYDFAWGASIENYENDIRPEHRPRWWYSHAYWWSNHMHGRFLETSGNLALLREAVTEIRNKYLTPEKIAAKRDAYYDVVFPLISSSPDWDLIYLSGNDPERVAAYNQIFNKLSNNVEENYSKFLERADDPMPFFISDPVFEENHNILFDWSESVSLNNQAITYDLEIATTKTFDSGTIVRSISGITETSHRLQWTHPKGTYYFRVTARDSVNPLASWQVSYDDFGLKYDNRRSIYGTKEIFVSEDGGPTPPANDDISNPINDLAMVIDGSDTDWVNLELFPSDADDIANDNLNVIDWENVGIAHSDDNIYILYKNYNSIDPNNNSGHFIPWGWQAYIDTDNNPNTGFQLSSEVGADYMIEGTVIQRYNGSGSSWNWDVVGNANDEFVNNIEEFSFPRAWLGSPQKIRVVFQGANQAYGGHTTDTYPDSSASTSFFTYSFGDVVTPPTNTAPVATGKNLSSLENTTVNIVLNATDTEGDDLTIIITQPPIHGELTLSNSGLEVSYKPNQNYTGDDNFKFKVNDGEFDSNIAIVQLNIVSTPTIVGVSNPVNSTAISINGLIGDWSSLTLFTADSNDIAMDVSNPINWKSAGLAHSEESVFLIYQNYGPINPTQTSGSSIEWGWQTYFDINSDSNSGYRLNSDLGAEYLLEGNNVYQYTGDGSSWDWTNLGRAESRYTDNVVEFSFPRAWLSQLGEIKVAFYGNNEATGGSTFDTYPNQGGFEYDFGSIGEFGVPVIVPEAQRSVLGSPESHKPRPPEIQSLNLNNGVNGLEDSVKSGGGNISWYFLFFSSLLLLGRRQLRR